VENIPDALAQLNTYTLMADIKVVWFKDARLFESAGSQQRIIDQIQQAFETDDLDRAAKGFLNLCAKLGVDPPSSEAALAVPRELNVIVQALGEDGLRRLAAHCQERGWRAAAAADHVQSLEKAIEKGFPGGHYLVITATERIPKNRALYKAIQTHGLVVDCHVPLGERKVDKMAQEEVLRHIWEATLQKAGKRMHPALFGALVQLTGFDPATFRDNLGKLIDYAGGRGEIIAKDIEQVLQRTKSDPIYELTNAVAGRDAAAALFFLNTLLRADLHPLQILAALVNQMRKLMVAKDFVTGPHGRPWRSGMPYPQFQTAVLPAIQVFDAQIQQQMTLWQEEPARPAAGKAKKGERKENIDLALAPNPANAYPVYQTLLKSDKFSAKELADFMTLMSDTDTRLKTSGQDATLLIKRLVMAICGTSPER
jgi:DNA polymerase-3 subunit delta